MLGAPQYPRASLDFYPTPLRCVKSFLEVYEDDLPAMVVWEPFCGNGAISTPLTEHARVLMSTDLVAYEGFDADRLVDFFAIYADGDDKGYDDALILHALGKGPAPVFMHEIAQLREGVRPDAIISNPPYGKLAEKAVRKALELMEPEAGFVAMLMRHDWDTASRRADLFDHPAFIAKVTMRYRPRWIEGTEGSPRFSYAWYVWDFAKALSAPSAKPELLYVA